METKVTYRLKGETAVRDFATREPHNAMRNLHGDCDMMYAEGGYRSAGQVSRCCGDKNCAHERAMRSEWEGW